LLGFYNGDTADYLLCLPHQKATSYRQIKKWKK